MIDVVFRGTEQVARNLRRAAVELDRQERAATMKAGLVVSRNLKTRMSGMGGGVGSLNRRTGGAVKSIRVTPARKVGNVWSTAVGSPGLQGRILAAHEEGKTINGKPWLTIPLKAAMSPSGVAKGPARSFPNTFFMRTKAGALLLVQSKAERGTERFYRNEDRAKSTGAVFKGIKPLFLLVRRVRLPARHVFRLARHDSMPAIDRLFRYAVQATVRVGNGR